MKHEKKEQILCGSNFSLKSDIIYSEYISKEEFIIQNTKNKQIIFEEKNFVLYKLTEFELFENAIIFCNNLALKSLFKYLNKVTEFKNIKIITHQTDQLIDSEIFNLKPECISKWFSVNVGYDHPDLVPIPLGLGNDFQNNQINSLDVDKTNYVDIKRLTPHLYLNFKESTNFNERKNLYDFFINSPWVKIDSPNLTKIQYINNLNMSNFVLCPWGNGIDTHRLWESLYYGKIPITKFHHTYSDLTDLPILFVEKYEDITEETLNEYIRVLKNSKLDYTKLNIDTWFDLIRKTKVENFYKLKIKETYMSCIISKLQINLQKKLNSKLKIFKYYFKKIKNINKFITKLIN